MGFTSFGQQLEMTTRASLQGEASGYIKHEFTITNVGEEQARFYWVLDKGDVPRDWVFSICDSNICYPDGTESAPCPSGINVLEPGQSIPWYKVEVKANDAPGNHEVAFKIISDCDSTDPEVIETVFINFEASLPTTSTKNIVNGNDIVLYPNPTVNRFQINQDQNVASIALFNIVGKNISTLAHKPGQIHDVSDLENGFYLVRMLDKNQNTLKVIRLTKE